MICAQCGGTGVYPLGHARDPERVGTTCVSCHGAGVVPPSPVHPPPLDPDADDAASYCEWYATQIGLAAELVKSMLPITERVYAVLTIGTLNGEESLGIRHAGGMTDDELSHHLEQLARLARGAPLD